MKCSCARSNRACLLSKISPTKFLCRSASVSTSWSPPLIQFEETQAADCKQLIAKLKNFQTQFLSWSLRLGIATRSNKISSASSSTPYFSFLICFRVLNGLYVLYLFYSDTSMKNSLMDQFRIGPVRNWINLELDQFRIGPIYRTVPHLLELSINFSFFGFLYSKIIG